MPGAPEQSRLHVEGIDDKHTIIHLLIRHGIDYDTKPWPIQFPSVETVESVERLLEGMEVAIRLSSGRSIGFVLDADSPLENRWSAVRNRLVEAGVEAPAHPPLEGFIGESKDFRSRVGIWLMPDNQFDGKIEHFLEGLVPEEDVLLPHARTATKGAKQLGAKFSEADRIKAVVHAWLAWQEEPGLPYGTAVRAKFFTHDSAAALAFVKWFKTLYRIETQV
jgi:hypothetical protein